MSVSKLSEELVKAGQDVTVLATTANGKGELEVPAGKEQLVDGVKVYYFKRLTKDHTHFSPALLKFLHQTIRNTKRETPNVKLIIHIHAWWNLVSIFSCLVAKLHRVKVVLSPRGMLNEYTLSNKNSISKYLIHILLGKPLLKKVFFHATSNVENSDIVKFVGKKAYILPNFIKLPQPKKRKILISDVYHIIFLGRINKIKGIENLISALTLVNINWSLNIVGEGESTYVKNLKELAKKEKIDRRIKWLGHIDNIKKFDLLLNADILVLPSYKENFANVVIEALGVGTPVIVSEGVGVAEYVEKKDLGWITNNSSFELAETITNSFLDIKKRDRISCQSSSIINNDFNDQNLTTSYIAMYQKFTQNLL